MRIVSIGDIGVASSGPGRDMIHIGDEAMFEALVDELSARGGSVTGLSSAPDDSSARYGIDAIERIGFDLSQGRPRAVQRMRDVLDLASGATAVGTLPASDPAHAVVAAIADSDGVVVAGGGNLASTWPMHIFERATLAAVAARLGKPFIITGQTLGPALDGDDRSMVAQMLAGARLVGVREGASLALARELGVDDARLARNVDDASYVGLGAAAPGSAPAAAPAESIVVSLSTHLGTVPRADAVRAIARLLDQTAAATGATVLFHAHWASLDPDDHRGDTVLHEAVRDAMSTPSSTVPTTDSSASATLARRAGLQLTSRYHPAVFAASAGTPTLAISVDEYTQVKLRGALGGAVGNTGEPLSIEQLVAGDAVPAAELLWNDRATLRADGAERAATARAAASLWWDRIAAAL